PVINLVHFSLCHSTMIKISSVPCAWSHLKWMTLIFSPAHVAIRFAAFVGIELEQMKMAFVLPVESHILKILLTS
ncbi:hypothetical protein X975_22517, partial [Stegodyphus mimosarum]